MIKMLRLTSSIIYNSSNQFLTDKFESMKYKVDLNDQQIQKCGKLKNVKIA